MQILYDLEVPVRSEEWQKLWWRASAEGAA